MKTFADQINNQVFKNYVVEHDYTKDGAYVEHKTSIEIDAIKKIAKKMYLNFQDKMDRESFFAEFQTQMYMAAKRYEKGKTQEELDAVLANLNEAYSFIAYTRIVIKNAILDTYVQTDEVLTEKFQDESYYDAYMQDIEEETTNPIKKWYFENKERILTKSQLQFLEALNRGTAKEVYSKQDICNRKKRVQEAILKAYKKNFF